MTLPRHGPDAQGRALDQDWLGTGEFANDKRHQVGGHLDGIGEDDLFFPSLGQYGLAYDGRVRERRESWVDHQGDLEDRLKRRFVPAGKSAPGVGRFELCAREHLVLPTCVRVGAAVEAVQFIVEEPGEGEA